MNELGIVTVASRNRLAGARALAKSLRRVAPEASVFICLVDRPPSPWDGAAEPAECFLAEDLPIPDWKRFAFRYPPMERASALKPHAIRFVLDRGFRKVLYVDGDLYFYSSPTDIAAALEGGNILLTPHLTQPLTIADRVERDLGILHAGVYNAGLVAVRKSEITDRFVQWWSERLRFECVIDVHGGKLCDQRWLDLVPGLFPGVLIERSPGVNAAYWTLWSHPLTRDDAGQYQVGTAALVCFHFTGFDPAQPTVLSRHDPRACEPQDDEVANLMENYAAELAQAGWAECRTWGCQFDRLSDGTTILPGWREAVRVNHPAVADIEDPFDAHSHPDLAARLSALEPAMRHQRIDWRLSEPIAPPVKRSRWSRFLRRYLGA